MRKHFKYCTNFLFPTPSFLTGMARTLDLHGDLNQYNESGTGQEADLRGLRCDWAMVHADLHSGWCIIVDQNPEYLEQLAEAINNDNHLRNAYSRVFKGVGKENKHVFEMAGQRP